MSAAKDVVHKARNGQLWYDRMHEDLASIYDPESHVMASLFDLFTLASGDDRPASEKMAGISRPTTAIAQHWAKSLPVQMRYDPVNFLDCLSDVVSSEKILNHRGWGGHAARHLISVAVTDMLIHGANVMVIDSDLAAKIIKSSNYPIDDATLLYVPFPRTFIEFSKPILICNQRFRAASFYADERREIWCASLYYDSNAGIHFSHGRTGKIVTSSDDRFVEREFSGTEPEWEKTYRIALTNLWDFVTSRSVEIERIKRAKHVLNRFRELHVQGQHSTLLREVFALSVDRTIKIPEEQAPVAEKRQEWAYQVEVPGAFHRWCYCASCGDLHRQDLLGQPCRECGKTVGPKANLVIEKHWHAPHTRGPKDAPLKDVVRHVGKTQKRR